MYFFRGLMANSVKIEQVVIKKGVGPMRGLGSGHYTCEWELIRGLNKNWKGKGQTNTHINGHRNL